MSSYMPTLNFVVKQLSETKLHKEETKVSEKQKESEFKVPYPKKAKKHLKGKQLFMNNNNMSDSVGTSSEEDKNFGKKRNLKILRKR